MRKKIFLATLENVVKLRNHGQHESFLIKTKNLYVLLSKHCKYYIKRKIEWIQKKTSLLQRFSVCCHIFDDCIVVGWLSQQKEETSIQGVVFFSSVSFFNNMIIWVVYWTSNFFFFLLFDWNYKYCWRFRTFFFRIFFFFVEIFFLFFFF